jgi:endogenous inhibitor of DNA gyrase (YacG/DUF329 family)
MAERCRYCKRPIQRTDAQHARYWPFCSERCKMAELGHWFEGRYRIGRPVDQVADDAALKAPAPPGQSPASPRRRPVPPRGKLGGGSNSS